RRKPRGVQLVCRRGCTGVGPDIAVALRNLSEVGARLLVTVHLQPEDEVELELTSAAFPNPIRVPANVVRSKTVPGNVYCVAVWFQKPLPYAQFTRLTWGSPRQQHLQRIGCDGFNQKVIEPDLVGALAVFLVGIAG